MDNITATIKEVSEAAGQSATGAQQTLAAAQELSKMAVALNELVREARK